MKLALMIIGRHPSGCSIIGTKELSAAARLPIGKTVNNWWIVTEKHKFGSYQLNFGKDYAQTSQENHP
ncbi:MAG: hypothetical protein IIB43_00015 [Candidatus Marinimicrobia bacterium]|nr:hypothetical protein [Candidatus Neomarinimicrobiota bacterium]